jgi:hypothetical protein
MSANDFTQIRANAVTPSDTTVQTGSSIYSGAGGSIVLDTEGGDTNVTFAAVPAGRQIRIRFVRVKAASTATGMIRYSQ